MAIARKLPQFQLVLFYEDKAMYDQAQRIFKHLEQNLEPGCLLIARRWNFTELAEPEAQKSASRSLKTADIIILAAHTAKRLANEIRLVLESGLADRPVKRTALAFLSETSGQDRRMAAESCVYLESLAFIHGLNFFPAEFTRPSHMPTAN